MKRNSIYFRYALFVVLTVTGCASTPSETAVSTQPQITTTSPAATDSVPTQTQELISVTEASMQAGSTYYYVDGTILNAVPAGEFLMGADGENNTAHPVFLNDYWIYSTKVTNQQYAFCEAVGKCTSPNIEDNPNYKNNSHANDPVVGVTYDQAAAYCSFVHGRLPTEAEWEKSARDPAGSIYPWGNTEPSCDLLNFNNCVGGTTNVVNHRKGASYYGVLDLVGNTFEWVADWYSADYYASSPKENPAGPSSGTDRSVRSSSYSSTIDQISVTNRAKEDPQNHQADLGFRCVVDDPTYFAPVCASPLVYGSDVNGTPQPAESCPVLDIKQAQYCSGEKPMTNVTFSGPPDAKIDAGNCIPSGTSNLFTCESLKTVVSITANCQVNLSGNSVCPSGFSKRGGQCVANGSAGQCLNGNYNSSQQCCATQNSAGSPSPVCPVGTFYSQNSDACLAYPVKDIVSASVEVDLLPLVTCKAANNNSSSGGGSTIIIATPTTACPVGEWDPGQNCCAFAGLCY